MLFRLRSSSFLKVGYTSSVSSYIETRPKAPFSTTKKGALFGALNNSIMYLILLNE